MKKLFAGLAILSAGVLNAQWDTLHTGVTYRLNAIDANDPNQIGVVAVGFNPSTDSGAYGVLLVSADNGNTWWQQTEGFGPNIELRDVDFTNNQRAWIVGDSGFVVLRTIWFVTYVSAARLSPYALHCGYPVGDSIFYCAGEHGLAYRTFDYGFNWDTLSTGTTETINDIYFTDAANGWIVGNGGVLSVTTDSGSTWIPVPQPQFGFTDFNGFAYLDSTGLYPYLVGESGTAQFSIDGGITWYYASTGTSEDINSIRFGTANSGIMVGNNGYILRTENRAFTWSIDPSTVNSDLFGIAYANDTMAFICGDNGVVLRSNVDISSVQGQPISSLSAHVFPNPSAGPLSVNLILREVSDVQIAVFDATGQVVQNNYYESVSAGQNELKIGAEELSSGLYFMRISTDSGEITLPIVRD